MASALAPNEMMEVPSDDPNHFSVNQAEEIIKEIKPHNPYPRTIMDIETSYEEFSIDICVAFLGLIPIFGVLPLGWLWYKYIFGKSHILFENRLHVAIAFYLLIFNSLTDSAVFIANFGKVHHRDLKVQEWLDVLQLDLIGNVMSIASLLVPRVLLAWQLEIGADVAYYKAKLNDEQAATSIPGDDECRKVVEAFQHNFPNLFPRPHPARHAMNLQGPALKGWHYTLMILSSLSVLGGLGLLSWKLYEDDSSLSYWKIGLCAFSICIVTKNWWELFANLSRAALRIETNSRQLLLFTSLVGNQDYGGWTQHNRHCLREIFRETEEKMKEAADAEATQEQSEMINRTRLANWKKAITNLQKHDYAGGSSDISSPIVDDIAEVQLLSAQFREAVKQVFFKELALPFDLTDSKSVRLWWSVRQYIQIDFKDESCIMDFSSACTMLLLFIFLSFGLWDWILHKEYFFKGSYSHCGGMLLAFGASLSLSIVLYGMLDQCIRINLLQDMDSRLLITAARQVRLGNVQSDKEAKGLESTAQLLATLEYELRCFDDRQTLFGIPITATVRNGLIASLGAALTSYAWDALCSMTKGMDIERIVEEIVLE